MSQEDEQNGKMPPQILRSGTGSSTGSGQFLHGMPQGFPLQQYDYQGYDDQSNLYANQAFAPANAYSQGYYPSPYPQPNPYPYQQPFQPTYRPQQQAYPQQAPVGSYLSPSGVPVFLPIMPTAPSNVDTLHVVISDYSQCDRRDLYEIFSGEAGFQRLAFQTDGYSFVKFDNNDVAVACLQRMRDRMLAGDSKIIGLKVGVAKCSYVPNYRIPAGPDQYPPSPTLHLSHFPRDATVLELRRFFSVFEGFDRLVYHINYAHVLFSSVEHASTAKTIVNNTTNFITAFAKNIQGMGGPMDRAYGPYGVPMGEFDDQGYDKQAQMPASRMGPGAGPQDPIRDIAWLVAQLQARDPNLASVLKQLQQSAAPVAPTGRFSPGRSPPSYRPVPPAAYQGARPPPSSNPAPGPLSHEHLQRLLAASQARSGDADWSSQGSIAIGSNSFNMTNLLNATTAAQAVQSQPQSPPAESARPRSESHDSKGSGSGDSHGKGTKNDMLPQELLSDLLDGYKDSEIKTLQNARDNGSSVSVPSSPFKSGWNSSVFGGFGTWAPQDDKKRAPGSDKISPSGSSPHDAMAREIAKNLFDDEGGN